MIENNLFVITGIGQLRNIHGFIDEYQAKNNMLIVLYTERNMSVVKNINSNLIPGVFREVFFLKQPDAPLKRTHKKAKVIYNLYEEQIKRMQNEYGMQNLFLCNRDNYYYFFRRLSKKYHLTLNMLEEGLTTYRLFQEEWEAKHYSVTGADFKHELNEIRLHAKLLIKAVARLLCNIVGLVTHIDMVRQVKQLIAKISKYNYGIIEKFNNYYVCYPEIIQRFYPKEKNIYPLKFAHDTSDIQFVDDLNEENVLFVNQRYGVDYKSHFKIIFSILHNLGLHKVYIKFHPRENKQTVSEIVDYYQQIFKDMKICIVDNAESVPVEDLLVANSIDKIIALTSSSLFYSKLVKPDIEAFSIAEAYTQRCQLLDMPGTKMKMFLQDYHNIQAIFEPKQAQVEFQKIRFVTEQDYKDGTTVFLNDRFGLDEMEQYLYTFDILRRMGCKKVYFKFAYRNDMLKYLENQEFLNQETGDLEIVPLFSLTFADISQMIEENNITTLIGINHPLLYDEDVCNKVPNIISISDALDQATSGMAHLYSKFEVPNQEIKSRHVKQFVD